jgi:hypothetical protein
VALDGGHLFASFGERGNKGGHRQHVGRQRLAPVLAALGGEAAPIPSVGALRVGRPFLPRVDVPGPSFRIVIDVAHRADGLSGGKTGECFHSKTNSRR